MMYKRHHCGKNLLFTFEQNVTCLYWINWLLQQSNTCYYCWPAFCMFPLVLLPIHL